MGMDGNRLLMIGCQWLVRMVGFQLSHPLPEVRQPAAQPATPAPALPAPSRGPVTALSDLDRLLNEVQASVSTPAPPEADAPVQGPTTEETVQNLKARLVKELYRLELDLQGGLRIAGKPCDCAGAKHNVGVEATAEELMSYEANPVYGEVIDWYRRRLPEFDPKVIATKPVDYYRAMTPEVRSFRKALVGDTVVQV